MEISTITPRLCNGEPQIQAFFTLRNAHISEEGQSIGGLNLGFSTNEAPEVVESNRRLLAEEFRLDPAWIAFANQVHSNRLKVVTAGGTFAETDSLITEVPGLALAIQVADCAAVLVADPERKIVAAIHAGWRGAAGDIVLRTMDNMSKMGSAPSNRQAFISPCISLKNFEVGEEVADQFPDQFVDYKSFEKPHIDLKDFVEYQLQEAGLKESYIETHNACTVDDPQFYSYRRQGAQSGRMMAVIKLQEAKV